MELLSPIFFSHHLEGSYCVRIDMHTRREC
jgi:hypothetical protein